jgi:hypothetical protein
MAKSCGGTNILVDGASGMTTYVFASDTANSGKGTDWTIILGRRHLDRTLRAYAEHYNHGRPHRALALATPWRKTRPRLR